VRHFDSLQEREWMAAAEKRWWVPDWLWNLVSSPRRLTARELDHLFAMQRRGLLEAAIKAIDEL